MKWLHKIFALVFVMAVAACASGTSQSTVDLLNRAQPTGSPFTKYLAAEYRVMANEKQNKSLDYADALHFARKGLASANGIVVMPEVVDDWDVGDKNLMILTQARAQLVKSLEGGGRSLASDKAALAQAKFDCWVEQQEKNWGANVPCKTGFTVALNDLDETLKSAAAGADTPATETFPEPVVADTAKAGTVPLDQAMFIVFFDWDKYSITDNGNDVLDAVAEEIKNRRDVTHITIVGHTDTSGGVKYNQKLSLKRGKAVLDALANRGLSRSMMSVEGRGKTDLLVKTADGVREPANRRAQITLE